MSNDKHLINWRESRGNMNIMLKKSGIISTTYSMNHYVDILTFLLHKSNKAQSLSLHTGSSPALNAQAYY